jgi:hypothetical protein
LDLEMRSASEKAMALPVAASAAVSRFSGLLPCMYGTCKFAVNYRVSKSFGDPNENGHPVVNMSTAGCMHAKCVTILGRTHAWHMNAGVTAYSGACE